MRRRPHDRAPAHHHHRRRMRVKHDRRHAAAHRGSSQSGCACRTSGALCSACACTTTSAPSRRCGTWVLVLRRGVDSLVTGARARVGLRPGWGDSHKPPRTALADLQCNQVLDGVPRAAVVHDAGGGACEGVCVVCFCSERAHVCWRERARTAARSSCTVRIAPTHVRIAPSHVRIAPTHAQAPPEVWQRHWRPMWLAAQALNTAYSYFWDVERDWEIGFFSVARTGARA